jgi:PAS domain S-box-containing protein/putative nucleotidyltransferase with HDIG domain
MTDAAVNILLLEDEPAHAEAIRRALEASDLKAAVRIVGTLREYREIVAAHSPNIVLMDMALPDGRALDALALPTNAHAFPVLIMTSYGNEHTAVEAMKAGALDYIVKSPEAFASMPHAVERALREWAVVQEHKRAEASLRESEERFRSLYENSTLGLYRTDPDGHIILANPALVSMLGYASFDEISGRDLKADGFEPSYPRSQFIEMIEKDGVVNGLESAWKRRDGTTVFVRESARALRGPEGQILYFDGTVEDVTDRKRAEEKLAYEQDLLRALMENATDQVYFKDRDSQFIRISKAQADRFGLMNPAQAEHKSDFDYFDEEHARQAFLDEQEVIRTGRPLVDLEEKETTPSGRVSWVSTTKVPLRDKQGQIFGTFGISRDITERKQLEEAMRQAEENFRRSLDESPLGVRIVTAEGETIYANKAILDLYGLDSLEEMKATSLKDRYTPQAYAEHQDRKEQRLQGASPSGYEISIVRKNGEIRVLQVLRKEVLWSGGKHYQALYLDITARKAAEKQVQETLQRLNVAMTSTIQVLGLTVEARDPYTAGHQQKVTTLLDAIAREMGLSPTRVEGLHMAGLVHDIGKISIPAEILSKPTKLTPGEYALVKTHAQRGYEILKDVEFPWPLAEIVYQHHERMDGSGYPRGLKGDEILLEARILSVSDTMEAMVSHRPYRPALGPKAALAEIKEGKGSRYDANVVEACLKLFREKRFSFPT